MSLLRSSLFAALLSLFVLAGYGCDVLEMCCPCVEETAPGHDDPAKGAPAQPDCCQCLCHQALTDPFGGPVVVNAALLVVPGFPAGFEVTPPEVAPPGIEYPPQLA